MVRTSLKRLKHGEVTALRCRFDFPGNVFRIWVFHVDGLMLETGPRRAVKEVERFAQDFPPRSIALSHFHEDHAGNAARLAEKYGAPVYMGDRTAEILAHPPRIPLYRRVVWGPLTPVRGIVTERIETERFRFLAVSTPGHADDHVSWVEEERGWAFTGDLYLGKRLTYGMRNESVSRLAESIRRVLRYPVRTVFCSHAGMIPDGPEALKQKLHFLEWLQDETLRLHREGARSGEIASRLLKKRTGLVWFSNGELSPVHLIHSIIRENRKKEKPAVR
ncbi:glyoxylase-like metal-dependent hydrolase (beta-lactamase superfamily II) [Melghirimyces profundicolus]|uniref:Glyoxylase-like metal-dependent hydrolase (Beta-lactamase superfamily II) n=1 Tax=Melghirimyces profundicolus TaxID=1242148 RepID=A0A2T6C7D5_9BACL|nr:MBL fold metallo-hydrolase [Melghirimyces profundicolus]PTX64238.1 glyoxylase-like metal-dependent hydrolase (beta-lactamase superfamily II) [Melghirimyces profundicolus]